VYDQIASLSDAKDGEMTVDESGFVQGGLWVVELRTVEGNSASREDLACFLYAFGRSRWKDERKSRLSKEGMQVS
jgi:hypothetical protein